MYFILINKIQVAGQNSGQNQAYQLRFYPEDYTCAMGIVTPNDGQRINHSLLSEGSALWALFGGNAMQVSIIPIYIYIYIFFIFFILH